MVEHFMGYEVDHEDEVFYATVAFGFSHDRLHQMWLGTMGTVDWRPVPMIELGKQPPKPAAIAGWVSEDDEGE